MTDTNFQIDFNAPAVLRKWPSIKNERVSSSLGASPYLVAEGTLDECMRQFMAKPINQHHLYEIHTAPQSDVVSAILSAKHIVEGSVARFPLMVKDLERRCQNIISSEAS
ncbi:hypothetical protein [Bradyrhizobium erythrophlei]|uniref:hypothetical protein n=1 Tax=Bradyrhizobium erythrophlei TaxID=1437360 RepID=UPI0018D471D2|nr:hypothetical protein [Bradyrhizobium erythrophlei]